MLYRILKPIVRVAMLLFCRRIIVNKPELLKIKGPVLLASNHPNSFLDSIILDTLFEQPVWSLARGDVFKNKTVIRILSAMRILPVYRTSEGVENLSVNYETFNACVNIFRENGIVQIFSEGKCINEWHLRPLKKGTARLALKTWSQGISLKVLPVGLNYSSFRRFGKNMYINFGEPVTQQDFNLEQPDGILHQSFNNKLRQELEKLVFEIPKDDKQKQEKLLARPPSPWKRIILFIPAIPGWLVHAPLYIPVKKFTLKKAGNNDHYDSIITALLLISYPVYLLLVTFIVGIMTNYWWPIFLLLLLPFTAWSYMQLKPQLDK